MGFIAVYITHPNAEHAEKVLGKLLEKRLIACANVFPIESSYWWEGEVKNSSEVASIVKTSEEKWEELKSEVERIHPYDVPCIMKLDVEANDAYEEWIESETA